MLNLIQKLVFIALLLANFVVSAESSIKASGAMVPDEKTAVAIAIAVFEPIFGVSKIESQRPFHAELNNEIWHVYGTLPDGLRGGTAEAELSSKDGRIVRVWHSK